MFNILSHLFCRLWTSFTSWIINIWPILRENSNKIDHNMEQYSPDYYRSSRPEVFSKKGVLRNFTKFTGKHVCQSLLFNKVAVLHLLVVFLFFLFEHFNACWVAECRFYERLTILFSSWFMQKTKHSLLHGLQSKMWWQSQWCMSLQVRRLPLYTRIRSKWEGWMYQNLRMQM